MRIEFKIKIPQYRCHKIVRAAKIGSVIQGSDLGPCILVLEIGDDLVNLEVPDDWVAKHSPARLGYIVIYEDGYTSFSPAEPFESGYTKLEA